MFNVKRVISWKPLVTLMSIQRWMCADGFLTGWINPRTRTSVIRHDCDSLGATVPHQFLFAWISLMPWAHLINSVSWLECCRDPCEVLSLAAAQFPKLPISWLTPTSAMPLGPFTLKMVAILEDLKDYKLCLSCALEYVRPWLGE